MPDTSLQQPGDGGTGDDNIDSGDLLPCSLDSLMADGIRPNKGDHVEVKVGGTVDHIVNDTAYVAVETANGEPIPDVTEDDEVEQRSLAEKSRALDQQGSPVGGLGY